MSQLRYPSFFYDEKFVLKVSLLLKLTIFYGLRHAFMVFLAFMPSPKTGSSYSWMQHLIDPIFLITDIPVLLVAVAWANRHETAGPFWRKLWGMGRWLLALALVSHSTLLLTLQGQQIFANLDSDGAYSLIFVILDMVFLAYVLGSPRVKDIFADFPAPPSDDATEQAGSKKK